MSVFPNMSYIFGNLEQLQHGSVGGIKRNCEKQIVPQQISKKLDRLEKQITSLKRVHQERVPKEEKKRQMEEKRRLTEEKKLKDIEQELIRLKELNNKMMEIVNVDQLLPRTRPDLPPASQLKDQTSIPTINIPSLVNYNSPSGSLNARRDRKKKKNDQDNEKDDITNETVSSSVIGGDLDEVQEITIISQSGPSTGLRINEGTKKTIPISRWHQQLINQPSTSITKIPFSPLSKKAETNKTEVKNGAVSSSIIGKSPKVQEIADITKPTPSNSLRINEGASCSGINITKSSESNDTKMVDKQYVTSGTSLISGSNGKLEDILKNEFRCSICHELYINPVALSCSHIFCSFCIEQWQKNNPKCPACEMKIYEISPQYFLTNVVGKIVNTMDEESRKRRTATVKNRPNYYFRSNAYQGSKSHQNSHSQPNRKRSQFRRDNKGGHPGRKHIKFT